MSKITYEIMEKITSLSSSKGWQKELNLISWNGYEPKYDIRDWDSTHTKMGKGITLSKTELQELYSALKEIFENQIEYESVNIEIELNELTEKAPAFIHELKNIMMYMNENGITLELQRDILVKKDPESSHEALSNEIEMMSIMYGEVYGKLVTFLEKLPTSNLSVFFDLLTGQRSETNKINKLKVETDILYCRGKDSNASGSYTQKGEFIVFQDSICHLEVAATAEVVTVKRKDLLEKGVLIKKGHILEFTKDYTFLSPSAAASVVLARRANGWTEWKNENGITLDFLVRG
ncbi:PC4/YdbC family ssDNA-binding protein [Neobacillus niacini]|uniref:PC4/YdbC family ssDNA-binding protein n=1 Tax=Neobacillus niacini TaxID=86668 RepID=UPI002FFDC728